MHFIATHAAVSTPTSSGGIDPTDLQTSLIAWWEMEGASGASEVDAHGTNDLTDVNTVGTASGKVSNSREFTTATDNRLIRTDNADLSTGDIDFTFAFWVNLKDTGTGGLISKYGSAGNREYLIYQSGGVFYFLLSSDGTAVTNLTTGGGATSGVWYFIVCYHDATNNTINIEVNNGAPDSLAHSGGGYDSGSTFMLGNELSAVGGIDAYIDEVAFWKRLLTEAEKDWLYNAGTGRAYAEIL